MYVRFKLSNDKIFYPLSKHGVACARLSVQADEQKKAGDFHAIFLPTQNERTTSYCRDMDMQMSHSLVVDALRN